MKRPVSFLIPVVGLTALTLLQPGKSVEPFKWLEGEWTARVNRGSIVEEWRMTSDSTLQGQCRFVNTNGQENVYEQLLFLYAGGKFSYIITLLNRPGQPKVPFVITSFTGKGFVAENPEHDFPRRIVYELRSRDTIHAFIDGGSSLPEKRSDFYYVKSKN